LFALCWSGLIDSERNHMPKQLPTQTETEPLLTIAEIAQRARVSPGTVRNRINDGKLTPAIKNGKIIRIRWSDFAAAMAG